MAITLSKPNRFLKILSPLERGVNCKQIYVIYPITHIRINCENLKFVICDKLQTSCLMKRNISCHTVRQTMLLSSLQQLLEMSAFCLYTRSKTLTPSVNCIVNGALVYMPCKRFFSWSMLCSYNWCTRCWTSPHIM